jgi:hypothetical protein
VVFCPFSHSFFLFSPGLGAQAWREQWGRDGRAKGKPCFGVSCVKGRRAREAAIWWSVVDVLPVCRQSHSFRHLRWNLSDPAVRLYEIAMWTSTLFMLSYLW